MKKMKLLFTLSGIVLSASCLAQAIDAPVLKTGDDWIYKNTTEIGANNWTQTKLEVKVVRVTASSLYYSDKVSGSSQAERESIAGTDWSRIRSVNGKETVVNRPFSFPLTKGKTWEINYKEDHPNSQHIYEQWTTKYTVVGYETIEVPAGKFNALKIEAEGNWIAENSPAQSVVQGASTNTDGAILLTQVQKAVSGPITGRTYRAFWYVPEIKRWVKSVEEYYSSGGQRSSRYTGELESFKAAE